MSISASLEIKLSDVLLGGYSPVELFRALLDAGWTFDDNGQVSYLPVGDNDDFNWRHEQIDNDEVLGLIRTKHEVGEIPGVVMTWRDTCIGGEFLLFNGNTLSVSLSLNRKRLFNHDAMTDVNWYLERLVPPLNIGRIRVASIVYEEQV